MNLARKVTGRRRNPWQKRKALRRKIKFSKVNIHRHNDLTVYLQAWFKSNKKKYPDLFSYDLIAEKLGYNSKSVPYRIFKGTKAPPSQMVNKLIKLLELSPEEANYFILLAHISKTEKIRPPKDKLIKAYKGLLKKRR